MPITMWCFTLASIALVGIPPTSGFESKWFLAMGALQSDIGIFKYLGPATLLVSAFLTAGYLLSIMSKAFFPGEDYPYESFEKTEANAYMTIPMIILKRSQRFLLTRRALRWRNYATSTKHLAK